MGITHGTSSAYSFHNCRCDICVAAKRERDADYYRRNAEARKAAARTYYEQNRDAVGEKAAEYRERRADQIKAAKKRYYETNKDAVLAHVKAWRAANPELVKEQTARYREKYRTERRAKALARYYKLMAEDPERMRKQRRDWAKTQKGVLANRAARSKRRGAAYTPEALAWIAALVDPVCVYCGRLATEIDHLTPITRGGSGELSNLAPCCRRCNARKGSMTREEFTANKKEM